MIIVVMNSAIWNWSPEVFENWIFIQDLNKYAIGDNLLSIFVLYSFVRRSLVVSTFARSRCTSS